MTPEDPGNPGIVDAGSGNIADPVIIGLIRSFAQQS
jgi:hypothetical protein